MLPHFGTLGISHLFRLDLKLKKQNKTKKKSVIGMIYFY